MALNLRYRPPKKKNGAVIRMIEEIEGKLRIKGKGVAKGKRKGSVLKSLMTLSIDQDINQENSEIRAEESEIYGTEIKNRILVAPFRISKEGYPNTLSNLKKRQIHPFALLTDSMPMPLITDAVASEVPAIEGIDISLFETGDDVEVNGTGGTVSLKNVSLVNITTSILTSQNKILILKRSEEVSTYKGRWAGVSGYIEKGEIPDETALREIFEELGFNRADIELVRKGKVQYARDATIVWVIHPFLFEAKKPGVKLDWEHIEFKWIDYEELEKYPTVPKFKETVSHVLGKRLKKRVKS